MKRFRILAVDDDERILNFLRSKLKALGYEVLTAGNGIEALDQVRQQEPDLLVLDVMMPGKDGFETLKELRTFSGTPVIILSGRNADADKIRGLGLGADDYLVKPFNPEELIARIEAVKRRMEPAGRRQASEAFSSGEVAVDFKGHSVTVGGRETYLTRIEWLLLSELAGNAGRLMTYEELLSRVWGPEYRSDVQLLRTWVSRLRRKLGSPPFLRTIPKSGYILDQPVS